MTDLLITFVIPILVIIASAILQKILRNPFEVAGIIFIILIIVALVLGGTTLFITLAWVYTILALITALIVSRLCCRYRRNHRRCRRNDDDDDFLNINLAISNNNQNCDNDDEDDDDNDSDNNNENCGRNNRHWRG